MRRTAILINLILLLGTLSQLPIAFRVQGEAIIVDTPADIVADDGKCSLREAIAWAETPKSFAVQPGCSGSAPEIVFSDTVADKVIVTRPLTITGKVTIRGLARHRLALSGDTNTRILMIEKNANVTISDLELRDAADSAIYINGGTLTLNGCSLAYNVSRSGGAIYNNHGTVTLNQTLLSHNRAGYGGAIFNDGGTVMLTGTTVERSFVSVGGGAIYSQGGVLTAASSTFEYNKGSLYGGALYLREGKAAISASVFAINEARKGGGIYTDDAEVSLLNNTFVANQARGAHLGGGALFIDSGTVSIVFSTLAYNNGPEGRGYGGAIYNRLGVLKLRNSIVALNIANASPDILGLVESQGYNLLGQKIDGMDTTDIVTENPRLARGLGDHGRGVKALALLADSPAIDAIPASQCPAAADGRGSQRPWGFRCDIGAYEHDTRPVGLAGSMRAD